MDYSLPGSSAQSSPGKSTGVGNHFLLQGIFPTQGSNQVSCIAGRFFTVWGIRDVNSPCPPPLPQIQFLCNLNLSSNNGHQKVKTKDSILMTRTECCKLLGKLRIIKYFGNKKKHDITSNRNILKLTQHCKSTMPRSKKRERNESDCKSQSRSCHRTKGES